jgi:DNA-binding transcriptional LysR family regulator
MLDGMDTEAKEIRRGLFSDNQIRLAGVPTMAAFNVLSLINNFSEHNPEYDMIVEELDEDRVLFLLQSGGCDVAFCSNIKLSEKNYNILKVVHEDFSVAFASSHKLAGKKEITLAELKGQKFIFSKQESMLYDLCYNACVEAGFIPNVIMRTSRVDIAEQYVQSQRCCCMGLTHVLSGTSPPEQSVIHISDSPGFDYVLCWKKADYISPALKSFIGFFKKAMDDK